MIQMTEQAQAKRQEDTNELKTQIFHYMDTLTTPEIKAGLKAVTRGFNHEIFARLLVPRKWLDRFDHDPECVAESVATLFIHAINSTF